MRQASYNRILLKVSGESLKGSGSYGIEPAAVNYLAQQISQAHNMGVEVAVVIGGGNIWRGADAAKQGMDRATADYAGMLATLMNALALQSVLERVYEVDTRTLSAIMTQQVAEPYIRRRAIRHLEKGRVVLFAAGTGNPFMTTDTAAALRAIEIEAEVLLMAKYAVDGVYASDPNVDPSAKKLDYLSYRDALEQRLRVMDSTALSLCMDNNLPIIVFDVSVPGNVERIIRGEKVGSVVSEAAVPAHD